MEWFFITSPPQVTHPCAYAHRVRKLTRLVGYMRTAVQRGNLTCLEQAELLSLAQEQSRILFFCIVFL